MTFTIGAILSLDETRDEPQIIGDLDLTRLPHFVVFSVALQFGLFMDIFTN